MDKMLELVRNLAGILAVLGVVVEVTPIKISPLRWIGKRINKEVNDKIDGFSKRVDKIEYDNAMTDLRNIKSRIHSYGMLIRRNEKIDYNTLKSAMDDLDVYDFYKDKYKYMEVNGRQVKINGEVEADRELIHQEINKRMNGE